MLQKGRLQKHQLELTSFSFRISNIRFQVRECMYSINLYSPRTIIHIFFYSFVHFQCGRLELNLVFEIIENNIWLSTWKTINSSSSSSSSRKSQKQQQRFINYLHHTSIYTALNYILFNFLFTNNVYICRRSTKRTSHFSKKVREQKNKIVYDWISKWLRILRNAIYILCIILYAYKYGLLVMWNGRVRWEKGEKLHWNWLNLLWFLYFCFE